MIGAGETPADAMAAPARGWRCPLPNGFATTRRASFSRVKLSQCPPARELAARRCILL